MASTASVVRRRSLASHEAIRPGADHENARVTFSGTRPGTSTPRGGPHRGAARVGGAFCCLKGSLDYDAFCCLNGSWNDHVCRRDWVAATRLMAAPCRSRVDVRSHEVVRPVTDRERA